jgi:hypothetical protein
MTAGLHGDVPEVRHQLRAAGVLHGRFSHARVARYTRSCSNCFSFFLIFW